MACSHYAAAEGRQTRKKRVLFKPEKSGCKYQAFHTDSAFTPAQQAWCEHYATAVHTTANTVLAWAGTFTDATKAELAKEATRDALQCGMDGTTPPLPQECVGFFATRLADAFDELRKEFFSALDDLEEKVDEAIEVWVEKQQHAVGSGNGNGNPNGQSGRGGKFNRQARRLTGRGNHGKSHGQEKGSREQGGGQPAKRFKRDEKKTGTE